MRIIDSHWTGLSAGYRAILSMQTRLEKEFGRAVRVGHERKYLKELSDWHKKRRVFFALVIIAPLSLVGLCVAAYFFREVACVIAYWVLVVLTILVTLVVAGRAFIREMVNRPEPEQVGTLSVDLEGRWWNSLAPKAALVVKGAKGEPDFADVLERSLPEAYLAVRHVPATQEVLMVGPSGVWVFQVCAWDGRLSKQGGSWHQVRPQRDRWGRKRSEETVHTTGPDDEWLRRKMEMSGILTARLAEPARSLALLQGGVAFSSPRAILEKNRIQGNAAAYGPAAAWVERVRQRPSLEAFPPEAQLEALEALMIRSTDEGPQAASSEAEADRLYREAVEELRAFVGQLVKD
jgi:hypothetical protein